MASERVHVTVDASTCVGSGTCVGLAPEHFMMTDDGVAAPVHSSTEDDEALRDAEESCPVQAIGVTSSTEH